MELFIFAILFALGYIISPALMVYSWARWSKSQRRRSRRTRLSLAGLAVATVALVLGVTVVAISSVHHGVFLYVAAEHRIVYATGLLLSSSAVLISVLGALQDNPLRLKSLFVAFGTLSLWFLAGSGR